jgi:hypothetical protein
MSLQDELDSLRLDNQDSRTRRQHILALFDGAIGDLLWDDRKDPDDELGRMGIPDALRAGEITVEEMVEAFELELRKGLREGLGYDGC